MQATCTSAIDATPRSRSNERMALSRSAAITLDQLHPQDELKRSQKELDSQVVIACHAK
jgi:hypothetical protein